MTQPQSKDKATGNGEKAMARKEPEPTAPVTTVAPGPGESLTPQDLQELIKLVRRIRPKDFDDGQDLVIMVQKLSMVIQANQRRTLPPGITPPPG